ncbi:MAG: T9SS type A sorting domain-containing protein [Bacteroidales bacterium]|nr:T9SS type A sorting domain-containing protein [Bacteroidales bacterium]
MRIIHKLGMVVVAMLLCGLFTNAMAQAGRRYAEPVFDEVNVESDIPFSSAIEEGETSPITLYLDFYEPQGDTLSARPLVITVFGGAFVAGGRDYVDMVEYCTRLAQHGYAAASIDYRLLSIWNLNATSLVRDAYMAAQDVSSAIRFFKCHCEEYRIDPEQVFLLGNSAGSIAILCEMFMDESERPAETYESPDLGSMHSSGYEEYAGFSPAVAGVVPHWGGVLDLDVISKEEYVPLCMIHGTDDTTVPYDSGYCYNGLLPGVMPFMYGSHAMVSRLDELGVTDYEFHPFEGEGHAFYLVPVLYTLIEEKFDACFSITRDFLYNHLKFPTSSPEMEETMIQVYPNPATDILTISVGDVSRCQPLSVTVIDVTGREVLAGTVSATEMSLDVSHLPSGIYIIRLVQEDFWDVRKFLKR